MFLLPPGYKIEPVLTDPLIEDPVGVTFDGNGRMYVLEMRSYMQDADGSNSRAADQPHLAPRRHRRRRHVRQAHRVRRQPGDAARWRSRCRTACSSCSRPTTATCTSYTDTNGDGVADKKELFYAGAGRVHEHGVAAGRADLGARQLALHDLQPVPAAHRARTARCCARRPNRTAASGGRRRTTTARCGGSTAAARSVRSTSRRRSPTARSTSPDNFEPDFQVPWPAPGRHRRHAGRHEPRPAARRHAQSLHRGLRRRDLSRRSPAAGHGRRSVLQRAGRRASSAARRSS